MRHQCSGHSCGFALIYIKDSKEVEGVKFFFLCSQAACFYFLKMRSGCDSRTAPLGVCLATVLTCASYTGRFLYCQRAFKSIFTSIHSLHLPASYVPQAEEQDHSMALDRRHHGPPSSVRPAPHLRASLFKTTDASFVVNKGLFISTVAAVAAGGGTISAVRFYECGCWSR